ncbi:MAG: hypothetical protein JWL85_640 [Candidatus Saccharibacteria bacterium]|nr:hypothetical protein [Candidatus Saccharibacteria bacterium]
MDQSAQSSSALRQLLNACLTVLGLGLFLYVGSKALAQLSDKQFVEGKPMQQIVSSNGTLATDLSMAMPGFATPVAFIPQPEAATSSSVSVTTHTHAEGKDVRSESSTRVQVESEVKKKISEANIAISQKLKNSKIDVEIGQN